MTEEQMNELINVLNRIGDELQISNVSQPNRKYMRRLLEVRAEGEKFDRIVEEYEQKVNAILESGEQNNYQQLIDSYNKKIDKSLKMSEALFEEEERLEDLLSDDINHNHGYLKLEDN